MKRIKKQLKLTEVSEYLGNDPDRKVRAKNFFNTVRSVFQDNGLVLPNSTRIEIWGQDKKKKLFTLALFHQLLLQELLKFMSLSLGRKESIKFKL